MKRALLAALPFTLLSSTVIAATDPFLGVYHGQGRACFGGLFLRERTFEWNASFFRCGPLPYRRIAQENGPLPRVTLELSHTSKACGIKVVEIAYYNEWFWTAHGYPTREAYEHRNDPSWKDADAPERQVASCSLTKSSSNHVLQEEQ